MNTKTMVGIVMVGMLLVAGAAVLIPLLNEDRVTVAFTDKSNYETLIIAKEKGWLEEAGIRHLHVMGGVGAMEAINTGSADMAATGDGPAVNALSRNDNVKIVARFIGGEGMHRFIAHTDIQEPADLGGKKVGLQWGSSTHGAFLRWLADNDVQVNGANENNASKVTIVPLSPNLLHTAMNSGQIDAMAGSEPWAINTERVMGTAVHEIGNSSGQGSTFPITLFATQRIIDRNPDAVQTMIDILVRSNQFIMDNWDDAMQTLYPFTGVANATEQDACSRLQFFEVGFNETDIQSLLIAAEMRGIDLTASRINERTELRFLPGVEG